MRLINVETLCLQEFFGDNIPPYAILSHTWGPDHEELHFREMETATRHEKVGYKKIKYLCKQAATNGLLWAWCDTCCIDKSSSAELSESINSMFQWYRNAKVCYVYLSDISSTGDENPANLISRSRWTSRGWTLQELIAPETVYFYDQAWNFLGDKSSHAADLRHATGVNFGALNWPWTVSSYSIATRMSWASTRSTTRTEDRAYCMLGILGVHIPLLYGEGQNAFRRLQEELIKISDDETIFAHSGQNILATSPSEFSSGKDLTLLRKDHSIPYSITNTGLHIHMRVLKLDANAEGTYAEDVSAVGILNCHHNNNTIRNGYIALPLQNTIIDGTYRRAPSSLRWVDSDEATSVEYLTIFIQLQAPQMSRITLLEVFDLRKYSSQTYSHGSSSKYSPRKRSVRIYPTPPFQFGAILHVFKFVHHTECQPFGVITFFDLVNDRAGVLVLPNYSNKHANSQKLDVEETFMAWKNQERPEFGEIHVSHPGTSLKERVRVGVSRRKHMNQFVWSLDVEEVS